MTEEKMKMAQLMMDDIKRHEQELETLNKYNNDVKTYQSSILKYFSERPLYDVSLHLNLDEMLRNMLAKEILACERIINLKKQDFEQL